MSDIKERLETMVAKVEQAYETLGLEDKIRLRDSLAEEMAAPDFWSDSAKAQVSSKKHATLQRLVEPWETMRSRLKEIDEFLELGDESMLVELDDKLSGVEQSYQRQEQDLKFRGKYDSSDAILSIQAGAGGTDAQDWAEILLRMYVRWAEAHDMKTEILEESTGEEAGIKSVSLSVSGVFAYGRLKSEHGVHRLVRLSPFNSAGSRETSFAMVEVVPHLDEPEFELDESELKIDVYRAGGHGGQSVNTTDSAVRITHEPTGISVAIQNERSQTQNKETAMKILASKLSQLAVEQHESKLSELKGPNQEAAWGNQIRSYVLHPYTMVKDVRTGYETSNVTAVLDGDIDKFIESYLLTASQ